MDLPPAFERAIATEAVSLVNQAYAQWQQGQGWHMPDGYDDLGDLSARADFSLDHEPFGFVARSHATGNVFVTFRGTQSPGDLLADFTFPQVKHPWGNVEKGFWSLYSQCAGSITTALREAGSGANVIVTGHSLGAAMAVLAAADVFAQNLAASLKLYTFAGPRVGDLDFAAKFNASVPVAWRVVNTEDIVTTVPFATAALATGNSIDDVLRFLDKLSQQLNYEHVGTPVSFTTHNGSITGNHSMAVYSAALMPELARATGA